MPGVDVVTDIISGPSTQSRAPGATYFVTGITERGPIDSAVLCRSLQDYIDAYGDRVTYGAVYDDLRTFFGEGGGRAYVGRVVGPAAVKSSLVLMDRAGVPLATLRIDAIDEGAWGTGITVEVTNGVPANTFTITLRYAGESEVFADLATPAAAVDALARSKWARAVNLASVTVAPGNNPAVRAVTPLAGGTDDRAAIVAADYVTAADDLFGPDLGAGAVAVPGQTSAAVGAALIAHAVERNRIVLLATAAGQTVAQAIAAAAALVNVEGAERAGLFFPHVRIPGDTGTTRTIPPTGFVAAARARAHEQQGPWRAPAGEISEARFVVGLETELTRAEGDELDVGRVSAVRTIARTSRLYGWRSLSADEENWGLLTGRDTMNDLVVEALAALESIVFRNIDSKGHLFSEIEGTLTGMAERVRAAGGLYERIDPITEELVDPGFSVDVGPSVNTAVTIAAGQARARLAVRVSPTGVLVQVTIAKAALAANL